MYYFTGVIFSCYTGVIINVDPVFAGRLATFTIAVESIYILMKFENDTEAYGFLENIVSPSQIM